MHACRCHEESEDESDMCALRRLCHVFLQKRAYINRAVELEELAFKIFGFRRRKCPGAIAWACEFVCCSASPLLC